MSYDGRLAFVVGGSEGIGKATALALAARGADVAIVGRSAEKLDLAGAELVAARRRADQVIATRIGDVRDAGVITSVIDGLVADLGIPDLVVNCAGYARPGWVEELAIEHVTGMLATNLMGTVHVCRATVPHMRRRGSGTIVNTGSMAALFGVYGYSGYCASKYAVRGYTEALRRELRPFGIRVSLLCPPNTRTPGFEEENRHKPPEVLAAEERTSTVDPELVAEQLLRRLPGDPFLVIPTLDGRLSWTLGRLVPGLVDRALRRPQPLPAGE